METENLFYNDVLESYPTAYYYAMEVAEEISVWTKLSLSKYEISFLGMHFASYLERSLKSKKVEMCDYLWKRNRIGKIIGKQTA